ncbi:hypothetical protein [Caulobacter sp. DWR2-3-1b2]|uniref:hypothetical protein n=1 Tax=unclassified Caulobacter TaxID=2648921 RepID=UPI003CEC479A
MTTTPEDSAATEVEAPHSAKVGVVDTSHNVTTAFNEPINGPIADLADGDA